MIYGGAEVVRGHNENITMNASLSYDPDVGPENYSGMNFTWHYGEIKGNDTVQLSSKRDWFTGVKESAVEYSKDKVYGLEVTFDTTLMSVNKTYVVKLVVTKDYRNSSVFQVIRLVKGDPPNILQR